LWAIDSSETMLNTFKERFPEVTTACESVQEGTFFNRQFDAAIAIGLIFLLTENDQVLFINKVSKALKEKGQLLFTAPIETGEWEDIITGTKSFSLGYERYKELLNTAGFKIISTFEDEGSSHYYLVEKL